MYSFSRLRRQSQDEDDLKTEDNLKIKYDIKKERHKEHDLNNIT